MADTYQSIEKVITKLNLLIKNTQNSKQGKENRKLRNEAKDRLETPKNIILLKKQKIKDEQKKNAPDIDKIKDLIEEIKEVQKETAKIVKQIERFDQSYNELTEDYEDKLKTAQKELNAYAEGKGKLTKGSKTYEKDKKALQDKVTCLKWKL